MSNLEMKGIMQVFEQPREVDLVVYFAYCPEHGPEQLVYNDEDIYRAGGVHALEMEMERDTYWFVRLGIIQGERKYGSITFTDNALAALPQPPAHVWHLGRRNPSFGRSELHREIFHSLFQALVAYLESWNCAAEGAVDAYTVRDVTMSRNRLASLASALIATGRAHDMVEITVLKFWYLPEWSPAAKIPGPDLITAEFSLKLPVQIRWASGEKVIAVDVLSMAEC